MPDFEIVPASDARARREFFAFPYRLYALDPYWAPPLRSDEPSILTPKHPFFEHAEAALFIARRGGQTAGRIAAIIDDHAEPGYGSFGFFECADDESLAAALMAEANRWLARRGVHTVRGPLSPSINYVTGVLIDGYADAPCVGMAYNPPYYDRLLKAGGLRPAARLVALHTTLDALRSPKAQYFAKMARRRGDLRVRRLDLRRFDEEARLLWSIYSKGWAANWGATRASYEEIRAIGKQLVQFADPRFFQICEVDGKPAGVIVAVPDVNEALRKGGGRLLPFGWWHISRVKHTARRARILILGMVPEWQRSGIAAAFFELANLPGVDHYRDIEASWVLESNRAALRGMELIGARTYKRYAVYEKEIRSEFS